MIGNIALFLGMMLAALAICTAIAMPVGLLRWRMAKLYWQTHEGGSDGYRRDCLMLAAPLGFLLLGIVISGLMAPSWGFGIAIILAPIALAGAVAIALLPQMRRASVRIMRAHYPLETPHGR
jgi:hypothetical protein